MALRPRVLLAQYVARDTALVAHKGYPHTKPVYGYFNRSCVRIPETAKKLYIRILSADTICIHASPGSAVKTCSSK
eukprot:5706064-Prymnesium_polylepis.1